MFELDLYDLYWLTEEAEETDLCVHGNVRICIGETVLDDDVSLSAAALHLLRSVTENHVPDAFAKLFPTDGFCWTPEGDSIYLGSCPNGGFDGCVTHEGDCVRISLEDLPEVCIPLEKYREQVFRFADRVEAFFWQSKPKVVSDELDRLWYPRFWNEWHRRRGKAENP